MKSKQDMRGSQVREIEELGRVHISSFLAAVLAVFARLFVTRPQQRWDTQAGSEQGWGVVAASHQQPCHPSHQCDNHTTIQVICLVRWRPVAVCPVCRRGDSPQPVRRGGGRAPPHRPDTAPLPALPAAPRPRPHTGPPHWSHTQIATNILSDC